MNFKVLLRTVIIFYFIIIFFPENTFKAINSVNHNSSSDEWTQNPNQ